MQVEFNLITKHNIDAALAIYNWYVVNTTATFHLAPIAKNDLEEMLSLGNIKYPSFVILVNQKVEGFCYLSPFRNKEAYDASAEITLYLNSVITRKGIGKTTLEHLEKVAKKLQIKNLIGVITAENTASVELFKKLQYSKVGHLKNIGVKFGKPLDVVSFQKEI